MNQKDQKMSTSLMIAHVVILLANSIIVASGIYVNLMIPEHPAINLEIALSLGFFLGVGIPFLLVTRSLKGTLRDITLIMAVGPIVAAFDALLFLPGSGSYFSTFLSIIIGFSGAFLVTELHILWKISRMSFRPSVPKSAAIAIAFIILLVTPSLAPVFALSDLGYCTPLEDQALTFADELIPAVVPGTIERTVTETNTMALVGMDLSLSLSLTRYFTVENGSEGEYVQIKGILRSASETGFYIVQTPAFALTSLTETQEAEPLYELHPVREDWKGITMITTKSYDIYVEWDHVDNGPYMPPTYDIYHDEVNSTLVPGINAAAAHIPEHTVEEIRGRGNLALLVEGIAGTAIGAIITYAKETLRELGGIFMALFDILVVIFKYAWDWFIDNIVKCEMDDGWLYAYDPGSYWIFRWVTMGIGKWRDSPNVTVIWIDQGPPPALSVDGYIIAVDDQSGEVKTGGLGKNTYGTHVWNELYLAAFVTDAESGPANNIYVSFTLWLGPWDYHFATFTNETGIAQYGPIYIDNYNPDWDVYTVKAEVAGSEDTTDFSYGWCLVRHGQTYDRGVTVIEAHTTWAPEGQAYWEFWWPHEKLYYLSHFVVDYTLMVRCTWPWPLILVLRTDSLIVAHQSCLDVYGYPNGDKKIDIKDIAVIAKAFATQPGHPRWKEIADIYVDGRVDIKDIAAMAKHWGEH